jgi:hypothetical protein
LILAEMKGEYQPQWTETNTGKQRHQVLCLS